MFTANAFKYPFLKLQSELVYPSCVFMRLHLLLGIFSSIFSLFPLRKSQVSICHADTYPISYWVHYCPSESNGSELCICFLAILTHYFFTLGWRKCRVLRRDKRKTLMHWFTNYLKCLIVVHYKRSIGQ